MRRDTVLVVIIAVLLSAVFFGTAFGDTPTTSNAAPRSAESSTYGAPADNLDSSPTFKERLIDRLPSQISDGLEINTWGWFSDLQNSEADDSNYYDAEIALGVTKSFDQRMAVSFQGNFIDANGTRRGELEKGYASILLSEQTGSLLTIGKFNASFGLEARDFWDRSTGTTSLLFGAQPQDLVGVMLTQPVGESGVTLRPFISSDFQGQAYFNQSPSAGLTADYKPNKDIDIAVTNWVGPGYVLFGGREFHAPYPKGGYGGSDVISNWQGPNLTAEQGGTLYFLDGKADWQILPDLNIGAEYLLGTTGTSNGRWGWCGVMALANYDLTDKLRLFGRWSFLDDSDWLITGDFQRLQEISGGAGYQLFDGIELRGEFRHDVSSDSGSVNSVSVHLTFTY